MTKRRDWIKVRKDWWESPSHRLISPDARCFGVCLLYLADGDPEWRESGVGRLLAPDMTPLSLKNISDLSGFGLKKVRKMTEELIRVGTLSKTDDGTFFFPKYRENQENRSARSMRNARRDVHSEHDCEHGCEHRVNGEEEEEAEVEADHTPSPPAGGSPPPGNFELEPVPTKPEPKKKRKPRKKPKGAYGCDPASVEDTDQVLAWIAQAREWCGFKASRLSATFANRCYVNVPMTLLDASMDDWKAVINRQAVKDKENPAAGRRYLTLSTLCRPENFARMMERDDLD